LSQGDGKEEGSAMERRESKKERGQPKIIKGGTSNSNQEPKKRCVCTVCIIISKENLLTSIIV
jgi:hypothetical protein